jgi:predicted nucleic acid-binding protein
MKLPVIDACVAIKWFLPEANYERARHILYRYNSMIAPDLFFIELDAIITKKIRKREIKLYEANELYSEIRTLPVKPVEYKLLSKLAFELSSTLPITLYDACYLALAIEFEQKVYTADLRFFNGMKGTPFEGYVMSLES